MKFEIVTDTFFPDVNGVAMTLRRLTEGLRQRGHDVHVIRTGVESGPAETLAASIPLPGYREVRVGLPKPFELRSRWLKERPDAVYVATESPLGKSALKAANALGIPVATGFHTNFHEYVSRYGFGRLGSMAMAYLRGFHRRADRTLTPSPEMAALLAAEGVEGVHLLGRGVDTALFSPAKRCQSLRSVWGAQPAAPVALVVGRVAAEKNLDLAVAAFGRMRAACPDLRCVVVGDGPLRAKLEARHPWVCFTGVLTGEELAACYASADVLLFPSETETFGNVLLEGMASGLVTVSYDYAASALHVSHRGNGLKAPKGDAEAFVNLAVEALRMHPGDPLRARARETAEALGWNSVIGEFEHHLSALAVERRVKPAAKAAAAPRREKLECRTVFLSDIHLGTPNSKAAEVTDFLKRVRCRKLVLNGDIIDGWALRRGSKWLPEHTRVIRRVLKMTERDDTEVVYLRGNHDEILERFLPLALGRIRLTKEHVHQGADGRRYLVVHGDGFDSISTRHKWLALLGAVGYDFLLKVNRWYNRWRAWRGLEYFSLSKSVKARVKSAVCFVDRYEELLQELARHRKCDGIICGHIHTPEDKRVGDIRYLNSGDWVESLTAIIEHLDGRMELVRYREFVGGERTDHTTAPEDAREDIAA